MQNKYFSEVKGGFGFGCMRLKMVDGKVDRELFSKLVDAFIDAGFNYFDTAHGYLDGESEKALRDCLTARHKREEYLLTDKLTSVFFNTEEEVKPFIQSQLEICGVDYFDFYLMHALNAKSFEHFKACRAFEQAFELKAEGKLRHVGMSFHDSPEVLDKILTEYPQVEFVQIQFNYKDYEDSRIQSRAVYEVVRKHGKPVIVMEPIKGGALAKMAPEAEQYLTALGGGSPASYALRFASQQDGVFMVLSGMNDMESVLENTKLFTDIKPLNETELAAVKKTAETLNSLIAIPCTGCRYCMESCPQGIVIPYLFEAYNRKLAYKDGSWKMYYEAALKQGKDPSECLKCGLCEERCPQGKQIRDLLEKAGKELAE